MEITQIDCPCCGKKVSLQAKACPQCGHPIATTQVESPQRVADPYAKEVYEDIMTHRIIELICGIISIIVIIILFQQCSKWFNDVDKISTIYSKNKVNTHTVNEDRYEVKSYPTEYINDYDDEEFVRDEYLENLPYWHPDILTTMDIDCGSYRYSVPSCLTLEGELNEAQTTFVSPDGMMVLSVYKESLSYDTSAKEHYKIINDINRERGDSITYKVCYTDRYYISGFAPDNTAYYRHTRMHNGNMYTYIFEWQKEVYDAGVYILDNKMIRFYFDNN